MGSDGKHTGLPCLVSVVGTHWRAEDKRKKQGDGGGKDQA